MSSFTGLLSLFVCSIPCLAFGATLPTSAPSGVVTCHSGATCARQSIDGRSYRILKTPQLVLMVSIGMEHGLTYADVSIVNGSGSKIAISPEDFRLEVLRPTPRVLNYMPPQNLLNGGTAAWSYSEKWEKSRQPRQVNLLSATLEPNEGVQGRVFFETAKSASEVKMVLPVGGTEYEFPSFQP